MDGRFDEGVRLDFNSGLGDILLISHSGKIIGVRYKGKPVPLPHPVAYSPVPPAARGKLALRWKPGKKISGSPTVEMWISTPGNFTGTEGLSGRIYIVEPTGPIEDDPNLTDKKFPGNPTKSYRASRSGSRERSRIGRVTPPSS
jgi:hypothetical protein